MIKSRIWIFVFLIILLVISSFGAIAAIIITAIMPVIGIITLLLYGGIITMYVIAVIKVNRNQENKTNAIFIVVINSILLLGGISIWVSQDQNAILDIVSGILGIAAGIGLLATQATVRNYNAQITQNQQMAMNPNDPFGINQPTQTENLNRPLPNEFNTTQLREELVALKQMLDDGLITQAEYDQKKTSLLSK